MIYLSTHDCGTEFWNGDIIKSEKGRLVMFPAAYTHIHRGQKCPDNNNRYLVGGYINYYLGLDKIVIWVYIDDEEYIKWI